MTASVFHRYWSNIKIFAGINLQYMDIYHTKKQTKNIPPSCSYLLMKNCFISYHSVLQHPILKVAYVKKIMSWTAAILHVFNQETDL